MPRSLRMALVLFCVALLPGPLAASPTGAAGPTDRFSSERLTGGGSEESAASAVEPTGSGPSVPRIAGSLALVAALILGLGLAYRKLFASQTKAGGAVTVISRQMLTPRHQVFILRVGHRLLVVGDSGHGMQSLAEVTDPDEMSAIVGEATNVSLKADAFSATLEHVESQYEGDEALDGVEADEEEAAKAVGFARSEVQSLLAKVRQLAGQQASSRSTVSET